MKKQVSVRAEVMLTIEVDVETLTDIEGAIGRFIDEEVVIDTIKKPMVEADIVSHEIVTITDIPYTKDELVDKAIEEIKRDVDMGDLTAIDELLRYVPEENLKGYLCID